MFSDFKQNTNMSKCE